LGSPDLHSIAEALSNRPSERPLNFDLFLAGFGNVGRRFVHLLDDTRAALADRDIRTRIVGIATRRHGTVVDARGVDGASAARAVADGERIGGDEPALAAIARWPRGDAVRVLIETTPLNVQSGEPAASHIRAAFAAGAHVITANKGPIACAYRTLQAEASRAGRVLLFEGAVMDGIPIFSLVRETLPAARILGFRGVVNSTTNYLLDAMERGTPFAAALARMQADGVAEADPSLDLDGWDAAAKVAALANVWLDADITPQSIDRDRVSADVGARAREVRARGRRLKLVGEATRDNTGGLTAAVKLRELDRDDPLAILDGQANALELATWPLGRLVITQRDGGLEKTAYALLADLCHLRSRI
jgi:homoserine dehydrogenase